MSDVQTFIEVKQHPQSGPETPHTMCEKIEDFLKNSIFDYFLTFCHVLRPEGGGGLGVFAFHDVPSRRFAPRSVCFLRLKDAFGGIEISFLLGAPL